MFFLGEKTKILNTPPLRKKTRLFFLQVSCLPLSLEWQQKCLSRVSNRSQQPIAMDLSPATPRWNLDRPFLTGQFHQVLFILLNSPLSNHSISLKSPISYLIFFKQFSRKSRSHLMFQLINPCRWIWPGVAWCKCFNRSVFNLRFRYLT